MHNLQRGFLMSERLVRDFVRHEMNRRREARDLSIVQRVEDFLMSGDDCEENRVACCSGWE